MQKKEQAPKQKQSYTTREKEKRISYWSWKRRGITDEYQRKQKEIDIWNLVLLKREANKHLKHAEKNQLIRFLVIQARGYIHVKVEKKIESI